MVSNPVQQSTNPARLILVNFWYDKYGTNDFGPS